MQHTWKEGKHRWIICLWDFPPSPRPRGAMIVIGAHDLVTAGKRKGKDGGEEWQAEEEEREESEKERESGTESRE